MCSLRLLLQTVALVCCVFCSRMFFCLIVECVLERGYLGGTYRKSMLTNLSNQRCWFTDCQITLCTSG